MANEVTLLSGYAALGSAQATNGGITELAVANGYARQAVTLSYDPAGNAILVSGATFSCITTAWSAAIVAAIFDAATGGNLVLSYPIASVAVAAGASLTIPAGTIALTRALAASAPAQTALGTLGSAAVTTGPVALALSTANAWSAAPPLSVLPYAATVTPDASVGGPRWKITLTGALTLNVPANAVPGRYVFELVQDGTGSRLLTLGTGYKTAGGAPTLTTTASATDVLIVEYDGTTFLGVLNKAYA
jgi:hypothetical protein